MNLQFPLNEGSRPHRRLSIRADILTLSNALRMSEKRCLRRFWAYWRAGSRMGRRS